MVSLERRRYSTFNERLKAIIKMKKYLVVTICLTLFAVTSQAQKKENARWWAGIELMEGYTFKPSKPAGGFLTNLNDNSNTAAGVHAVAGYYVTDNLSLGLGTGFMGYNREREGYVPLFADVRYHPLKSCDKLLLNAQLGTALSSEGDDYKAKFTSDLSVGYALRWKAVSFIPAIGFNYTKFDVKSLGTENHKNRGTVYLKLGVTF